MSRRMRDFIRPEYLSSPDIKFNPAYDSYDTFVFKHAELDRFYHIQQGIFWVVLNSAIQRVKDEGGVPEMLVYCGIANKDNINAMSLRQYLNTHATVEEYETLKYLIEE